MKLFCDKELKKDRQTIERASVLLYTMQCIQGKCLRKQKPTEVWVSCGQSWDERCRLRDKQEPGAGRWLLC